MVNIAWISSAECYEETVLLSIELETFSNLLKDYFVKKLNRIILFFKSMNFLKFTTVKNLLLFASKCQESRIPSKTILSRQYE